MKINEVIKKVDLSKRAIKFYEEKGFLDIKRDDNGYRNYTEDDILILKEISVYRKFKISLSDIKNILKDRSLLNDILIEKREELENSQEELKLLENFINDEDIEKVYISVDYNSIGEAIKNAVPGFYGYYFLNHFLPYLQIKIENSKQQEAYKKIVEFWDNTNIRIPLFMKLSSWIMYKFNQKESMQKQINDIDSYIKMYLNPTVEEYEKLKKQVLDGVKIKNNFFYKYSIIGISQRKFMKELQNKGYNDIFIPNMIILSPKYREYHNALEKLNKKICEDLNLYYDSNFNLVQKKN